MSWGVCHVPFLSTFCWDPGQNLKFSTEDYKYNKMIQLLFTFILKCVAGWSLNTHSVAYMCLLTIYAAQAMLHCVVCENLLLLPMVWVYG